MPYTLPTSVRLQGARADHRRADDAAPPRQASPGLRRQREQGPRGHRMGGRPVEEVLANLEILPEDIRAAVRNNAGGHANHTLFWEIMSPDGGGEPEGELARPRSSTFRRLEELKTAVNDAGVKRFGSGWTWLIHDGTGLAVVSTPNQDSPISTPTAAPRHRRLGARLLPEVPEPSARLPRSLVERRQLGGGRRALRRGGQGAGEIEGGAPRGPLSNSSPARVRGGSAGPG